MNQPGPSDSWILRGDGVASMNELRTRGRKTLNPVKFGMVIEFQSCDMPPADQA